MTVVLDLLNNDPRAKKRPDMPRHPEKINQPGTPLQSKPAWILVKAPAFRHSDQRAIMNTTVAVIQKEMAA